MINVMEINGYKAVIAFDPEIDMFRGEFVGLNGGADFYAADVRGLHAEAEKSLQVFLDVCKEQGIEPRKDFSGKVLLRLPPEVHAASTIAAQAAGKSFNQWAAEALEQVVHAGDFPVVALAVPVVSDPSAKKGRRLNTARAKARTEPKPAPAPLTRRMKYGRAKPTESNAAKK